LHSPIGSGPASVYWLTQEYNGPARSLYDTVAHRTSFVVYRPEFGLKISHSTAERRLPWADPLRCAEEFAVFAGFTQAYWSALFVPRGVLSGSMAMRVGATGGGMSQQRMDADTAETVAGVVRLLRRAAELVWAAVDAEGAGSLDKCSGWAST
jgi:hypothetical protein